VVKWTVIEDVDPPIGHGPPERQNLGIQDFDYNNIPRDEVFACMFFHLMWIGIDEQLIKFNAAIEEHNESLPVSRQKIKSFSKSEIIVGYALFVAAAGFSEKGIHLFNTEDNVESFFPPPSFSTYMKFHPFKLWKQFIVRVNEDGARKRDGDPWWQFAAAIEGFNDVRLDKITTSLWDILDESMSSYRPRTTATGSLPNISFIFRKPEPLGTEFKCAACPIIGTMKCLKIQRGAKPMRVAKYTAEHGCTSGYSLRLSEACNQPVDPEQKRGVKGDSWFGHVCLADNFGQQGIRAMLQIKTGHALYPAKFMEEKLKEAPDGCWITMKGKAPRGTDLLAIGYKYNSKCVLKFVATSDAGSTKAGTPYDMKFCDSYNNVCVHKVDRPAIVSQFFDDSNCIDSHNHVRQFELALEKRWFTRDPFFRLHTTLTGITVNDVWRLSQYHKLITSKKDEDGKNVLTIKQFNGVLAKQLIKIAMSCENEADFFGSPTTASRSSSISPLSSDESTDYSGRAECTDAEGRFHEPSLLPMTEQKSGKKIAVNATASGAR
jgi:hypothetical protein